MPAAPLRRGMEGGKERSCMYCNGAYEGWLCLEPTMGITASSPNVFWNSCLNPKAITKHFSDFHMLAGQLPLC